VGVEIGGAMKNVIAIAAGVVEGLGSARTRMAGLITRGLAEIAPARVRARRARETLAGLSGLGDLVLTCTGALSRNRHVGIELARGRPLAEIVGGMKMVAEGCGRRRPRWRSARGTGSSCRSPRRWPRCSRAARTPRTAVEDLMLRPQKSERETA
jgi:glycerol-3-phosphate dehydrogenase (NAD(P)+)